ncbi:MAG: thiamine pyrophosphate-dependent enzyme [Gammaproteobacteria bacterium]|nr:MAG: thiamine pyrophosphate-dependent enzyme [Gammaproteobacteria bacterium]
MTDGKEITLDRRKVVARILRERGDALLVTGLGNTTWDAAAAGDHNHNFYLWGAMGGAALVGLGLALAQPARRVLVITGDGEMLMGLGGLATIAVQRPANLAVIVIDNEAYAETGMQATHTRHGVDLAGMAAAAGFSENMTVFDDAGLETLVPKIYQEAGPVFAAIKVAAIAAPTVLPPRDGTYIRSRFRQAVLGAEANQ